ncbi:MAG: TIR domain-containing protein [Proteobacteria bacterium]|nr:TIR domain-containing protein [Pseudomonadota bacterium]
MSYTYEVALSFTGEDRRFAEAVAKGLRDAGIKVFYDDFYADELWGQDLSVKLREAYHDASEFCIMIISEHYVDKMWPSHERQQAIERMIRERGKAYVLPVRLDGFNGDVPGLSGAISYLAVSSSDHQKIVDAFLRKVGRYGMSLAYPNQVFEQDEGIG